MVYKVSNWQMFCMFFTISSFLSFGLPNLLVSSIKQDFWEAMLLALGIEGLLAWMLYKMGLYYIGKTMFEFSEVILGRFLGKVFSGILTLFFSLVAALILRAAVDFFAAIIMPETPTYVFILIILLVSTYAVRTGIEAIMRLGELIAPMVFVAYLFIIMLNIKIMDLDRLKPMFQHGINEIAVASLLPTGWYGVCIIVGVFMAYHNRPKDTLKIKMAGLLLGISCVIFGLLTAILVFGVQQTVKQQFPLFQLSRMINVGGFIERIESVQVVSWVVGGFYGISTFHYASTEGLRQILKMKSQKNLAWVITGFIYVFSTFLFYGSVERLEFLREVFPWVALAVEVGGITTLFTVFTFRKKFGSAHGGKM
jgi:spore germination protein KB